MMTQVLHIFRKDVRHLWIELTVSLLADAAFVAKVLSEWNRHDQAEIIPGFLSVLLRILVPFCWCLLVVRSIQDESLVGDRQFWITRPYTWRQLLAAKLLFAVVFIHVPLLICNCIFLAESGFSPLAHLPGLAWIHLSIFIVLVLATATVSVVTSTLVQVVLWVIGIAVYVGCASSLSSFMPESGVATGTDMFDWLMFYSIVAACVAIVLWQYAQRRAWIGRAAIVSVALVLTAGGFIPQPASQVLQAYPPLGAGETAPFQAVAVPLNVNLPADALAFQKKTAALVFPLRISGISQGSLVQFAGVQLSIRLRDGKQWNSRWEPDYDELWPSTTAAVVGVTVDRQFLEQSKFVPAVVNVSLAYTEYREENPRQIVAQPGIFPVEGIGYCWTNGWRYVDSEGRFFSCRAPLRAPKLLARYESASSTCRIRPGLTAAPPTTNYASLLDNSSGQPHLAIVPIAYINVFFQQPADQPNTNIQIPGICPGTPFTIANAVVVKMRRTSVVLDGVELNDYVRRAGS